MISYHGVSRTDWSRVDRLRDFSTEVTRVAREVGSEGRLGGQAKIEDVNGVWSELTQNVNEMASNLTSQVRSIALGESSGMNLYVLSLTKSHHCSRQR